MADLLDRIHGEIRARLQASEAAVLEYGRLQAALVALDGVSVPGPSGRTAPRRERVRRAGPTEPRCCARSASTPAPA